MSPASRTSFSLAVAPVFLLTAIATLISALNVRLGRIVDRQRALQAMSPVSGHRARRRGGGAAPASSGLLGRRVHLSYLAILAGGNRRGCSSAWSWRWPSSGCCWRSIWARVLAVLFVYGHGFDDHVR